MPKLIRLYIQSVLIGFGLSAAFVALLVWMDVGGVGRLILGSDQGHVAAFMLFLCNGVIFSGVQFALRVMAMAEKDDAPRGGLRQMLHRIADTVAAHVAGAKPAAIKIPTPPPSKPSNRLPGRGHR